MMSTLQPIMDNPANLSTNNISTTMARPYGYIQVYGPIGFQVPPTVYSQVMSTTSLLPSYSLLLPYTAPVTINNPLYDANPIYINGYGSPFSTTGTPLSPDNLQSTIPPQALHFGQHEAQAVTSGYPLYQPELYNVVANTPVINQFNPFTNSPPIIAYSNTLPAPQTAMQNELISQVSQNTLGTNTALIPYNFTLSPTINSISTTIMQPTSRLPQPLQQVVYQTESQLTPYYQTANNNIEPYGLHLPSYQEAAWYTVGLGQYPLYEPALQQSIAHSPLGNYFNPFSTSPSSPPDSPTPMSALLNNLVSQVAGLAYQHLPLPPFAANIPLINSSPVVPY